MSELKSKLEDYIRVTDFKISYEFESGNKLAFSCQKEAFPHLLGLHKLEDIPLIRKFNNPKEKTVSAKYLIGKIRQEKLRKENGLTQEKMASSLGVTFQAVSRWENGTAYPDIELIPKLAAMFKVSIDTLLGYQAEKINSTHYEEKYQSNNMYWGECYMGEVL